MANNSQQQFRRVNRTLDEKPKIGPIPADQFIPWAIIWAIAYYIVKGVLGASWVWTSCFGVWGMSTWWVLTSSSHWKFLSKFISVPQWTRGMGRYQRLLDVKREKAKGKG
ncbi:MAG: hypothetical protein F6J90_12725 [Moorea sp. SIOASIH]|uniref:hypothetical protein n=1 Tax=Moorena sp. SIOASIH TaxID=2607817 RepID=UPI0013BCB1A8|nr:hypothetical protein [Moorena sp. SIOASIH]NEO37131.1 hypothetical protein [Moorena sp. SIOASIH]NEO89492.1 hypothetical protein [Moorena sp. SIO3G5]